MQGEDLGRVAAFIASEEDLDSPTHLATGSRAVVFACGAGTILKLYPEPVKGLDVLAEFYSRASSQEIRFPSISSFGSREGVAFSIEGRLPGQPLSEFTDKVWEDPELLGNYVDAATGVSQATFDPAYVGQGPFSDRKESSWVEYLTKELSLKIGVLKDSGLPEAVLKDFDLVEQLVTRLKEIKPVGNSLIHGDLHEGNILLDRETGELSVIDFGEFTLFGDPLYDVAGAIVFLGMYETDYPTIRRTVLDRFEFSESDLATVNLYFLAIAVLTCDLYPDDDQKIYETGHFHWARTVLRDDSIKSTAGLDSRMKSAPQGTERGNGETNGQVRSV